jgi:hypothetical protein
MRRGLSIFLTLLFWLGPLAAILPASDESRLPHCCRRQGTHHRIASMHMASMMDGPRMPHPVPIPSSPLPRTAPCFPATPPRSHPRLALGTSQAGLPVLLAQAHSPSTGCTAARLSQIRTRAGRGPPPLPLA